MVRSEEQWRTLKLNNNTDFSMAMEPKSSFIKNRYHLKDRRNGEKGCTNCGNRKHAAEKYFKM